MARVSWLVVTLTFLFDITAFGLALGAIARRSQAHATYSGPGYISCEYTRDISTGLAVAAAIFLIIGQVLISVVTRCLCCGGATYKPSTGRVCAIILFVFSWIAFSISEIFLLVGASQNKIRTTGPTDQGVTDPNELYCKHVKKGIFAVGAAFSFLTILCSMIYYFLLTSAEIREAPWQSYKGENGGDGISMGTTAYN